MATRFDGSGALEGIAASLGDAPGNPLNGAGLYEATSATLPKFKSAGAYQYEGAGMAAAVHTDDAYKRLTRTVDLTGVTAAQQPTLRMQLLWDTEPGYDHVLLEAHTTGAEDWTTLPDKDGLTSNKVPTECEAGFFLEDHPALTRYLTPGGAACGNTGTSGQWNSLTGSSDDWKTVTYDLSAYAGEVRRGVAELRERPRHRRRGRARRQRLRRHRGTGHRDRGLRDVPGRLERPRTARGQPARREGLGARQGPVHDLRGDQHAGHRAPRIRSGTRHRDSRQKCAHQKGPALN